MQGLGQARSQDSDQCECHHKVTRFNQEVQLDLLFYKDKIVLHMLDRATRFTEAP